MSQEEKTGAEKKPFVTFIKTWKLFGFLSFSVTQTVSRRELIEDVSREVLDKINAEIQQKFTQPPRRS